MKSEIKKNKHPNKLITLFLNAKNTKINIQVNQVGTIKLKEK